MKLIKKADLFGAQIKFNIDGKSTYQSQLGGLVTIGMVICIGIVFTGQIMEFFDKTNIYSQQRQVFSAAPQQISLNQNNILFSMGIEQLYLPAFIERPFYNITITQFLYNQTSQKKTSIEIPLIPCTLERFKNFTIVDQKVIKNIFTQTNSDKYLCPPSNFIMNMKGSFLNEDFQFIKIQIQPCKNNTDNPYWNPVQNNYNQICASPQTVQNYIHKNNNLRFTIHITDYVVNPEQHFDVAQLYMSEDLSFLFQPEISNKVVNVLFRNYRLDTDDSLFITHKNNSQTYAYRGENSFTIQNTENLGQFYKNNLNHSQIQNLNSKPSLAIYFKSDYFSTQAQRKFMKIDDLISYFGGIFNVFLLIFGFFMTQYNDSYFRLRLANKLYDFKETNEIESKNSLQLQKISDFVKDDITNEHQQNKYEIDAKLSDVINEAKIRDLGFKNRREFLIWYFEKIVSKRKKLTLNKKYFIYLLTCRKYSFDNDNKLIDKSFKQVQTDMNIKHLLNQVIQVDKLKKLILTHQQTVLFDFFPKQVLTLQDKINLNTNAVKRSSERYKKQLQTHKTNLDQECYKKILDAFEKIITTQSQDETTKHINNKLVFLLGTELRSILKTSLLMQRLDQKDQFQNSSDIENFINQNGGILPQSLHHEDDLQIDANSNLIRQLKQKDNNIHSLNVQYQKISIDQNSQHESKK